jgi:hypothetical protein
MEATLRNMRAHYRNGVFAYSPDTGEECSANPSDYWSLADGDVLTDENDAPMLLVTRQTTYTEIGEDDG